MLLIFVLAMTRVCVSTFSLFLLSLSFAMSTTRLFLKWHLNLQVSQFFFFNYYTFQTLHFILDRIKIGNTVASQIALWLTLVFIPNRRDKIKCMCCCHHRAEANSPHNENCACVRARVLFIYFVDFQRRPHCCVVCPAPVRDWTDAPDCHVADNYAIEHRCCRRYC